MPDVAPIAYLLSGGDVEQSTIGVFAGLLLPLEIV
jgi:hypothetical protein